MNTQTATTTPNFTSRAAKGWETRRANAAAKKLAESGATAVKEVIAIEKTFVPGEHDALAAEIMIKEAAKHGIILVKTAPPVDEAADMKALEQDMDTIAAFNANTVDSMATAKSIIKTITKKTPVAVQTMPCACGQCETFVVVNVNRPDKQKFFTQGHDAKAKSVLCEVNKGRKTAADIPASLIAIASKVSFIVNNPDYAKHFSL